MPPSTHARRPHSALALTLMVMLCLTTGRLTATESLPSLSPMDVFELEYAANPVFSPDGWTIVYERRFMDIQADRVRSNLWQLDLKKDSHRPLTTGMNHVSHAAFSPDGSMLSYVSNETGSSQIHLRWLDSGQTMTVAQLPSSPSNLSWSQDSKSIAFTAFVKSPPSTYVSMPARPDGAEWADAARVIEDPVYRFDGAGFLPQGRTQLFVVPATGGSVRQVTRADRDHGSSLSWSSDSQSIFLSVNLNDNPYLNGANTDIVRVDVRTGAESVLTDRVGPDRAPMLSPRGEWLAYLGYDDRKMGFHVNELYLQHLESGERRLLTGDLDRGVVRARWADDGRQLYIQYDDQGDTRIARVSLDGAITPIASGIGGTAFGRPYSGGSFDVSSRGDLAWTMTTTQDLANIAWLKKGQRTPRQLTDLNADLLDHRQLASVTEMWFESSADGRQIQGWLATPPGATEGQPTPLILEIHGGPFTNYGVRFSPEVQLYAAAGYSVLYINPRGSTSYGEAFANLIHHAYPGQDYDDLMSGVDLLIEQGVVDPERLYVTGGSGGGVLTSWIIGKTDRFRAAVVAKPVINWLSFTLYADISAFVAQYWFDAMPWEDPMSYWKRSPLSLVGNVSTPTMLLTGEADHRTPIVESEQYYQALKLRDVETVMVRIPGASHGITRRPSHLIAKVLHVLKWFDDHGGQGRGTEQ